MCKPLFLNIQQLLIKELEIKHLPVHLEATPHCTYTLTLVGATTSIPHTKPPEPHLSFYSDTTNHTSQKNRKR